MQEAHEFLRSLTVVLAVAAITTVVFQRLRQPVVLGYIIAGLIVGPHVPIPLVADPGAVQTLSELGVILLMFSLGLEFSLRKLMAVGPTAGLTALLQSSLMVWLGFTIGRLFGWTPLESLFAGAVIAISRSRRARPPRGGAWGSVLAERDQPPRARPRRRRGGARSAGGAVSPRPAPTAADTLEQVHQLLPGLGALAAVRLDPGTAVIGRTLAQVNLRGRTGATVLAITRTDGGVLVPTAKERLRAGDVLAVAGTHEAIEAARAALGTDSRGDNEKS